MASVPAIMQEFLNRKYAIAQQQADATTQNAATAAMTGKAAANLDTTRAGLLPAESQANIGLTQANTRMANLNADWLPRINEANIANTEANTADTRVGTRVKVREGLIERAPLRAATRLMGGVYTPAVRLSPGIMSDQRRLPGESELSYMDRINGL